MRRHKYQGLHQAPGRAQSAAARRQRAGLQRREEGRAARSSWTAWSGAGRATTMMLRLPAASQRRRQILHAPAGGSAQWRSLSRRAHACMHGTRSAHVHALHSALAPTAAVRCCAVRRHHVMTCLCVVPDQVFCEEVRARSGAHYRHFVAAPYEALWYRYVAKDSDARHFYEARACSGCCARSPACPLPALDVRGPRRSGRKGVCWACTGHEAGYQRMLPGHKHGTDLRGLRGSRVSESLFLYGRWCARGAPATCTSTWSSCRSATPL